ncbi:MAG: hypothetical protein GC184_07195 [Rhizobiales bacterium]|nr:hypothetical protein [Hyphomicrobiales bacterium]
MMKKHSILGRNGQVWEGLSFLPAGLISMSKAVSRLSLIVFLALLVVPVGAHAAPELARAAIRLADKGIAATATGDYARAQRLLEEALVADPSNARTIASLGVLHQKRGNMGIARKYYISALTVDPANIVALGRLGQMEAGMGKMDDAKDKLRRLQAICPTCAETTALKSSIDAPASKTP